jgi:hypothetical protein
MFHASAVESDLTLESCLLRQAAHTIDPETSTKGVKNFAIEVLSILPARERDVIAARYGLWNGVSQSLRHIGNELGVTRERVRQIEKDAVMRLRGTYAHCLIRAYIYERGRESIENDPQKHGVLAGDEAITALAIRCSAKEVVLALRFLKDVDFQNENVFGGLIEIEPRVYCLHERTKIQYLRVLKQVESVFRSHEQAISESFVLSEISSMSTPVRHRDQMNLARRVLLVSPRYFRMKDGTIARSEWTHLTKRNATTVAEAALRLLGRPAHFREITTKVNEISGRPLKELTIHGAIIRHPQTFVWLKDGTYGLAAWGFRKPPFVTDRLIQLLSIAGHPLSLQCLEREVLDVCNCKPATVRMELHFNPQYFVSLPNHEYVLRNSAGSEVRIKQERR